MIPSYGMFCPKKLLDCTELQYPNIKTDMAYWPFAELPIFTPLVPPADDTPK